MRQKKCKQKDCGKLFYPQRPLQSVCSPLCASKVTSAQKEKYWKMEKKELKEKLMTHSEYLNLFQVVFNTYIRARDKDKPCISCGTNKKGIEYHAGHYFSVSSAPSLRFDEDNVHKQCGMNCNKSLHGNLIEYGLNLPKRIGQKRYDALYSKKNKTVKLSIPEIKEKIIYYKKLTKALLLPVVRG